MRIALGAAAVFALIAGAIGAAQSSDLFFELIDAVPRLFADVAFMLPEFAFGLSCCAVFLALLKKA